MNVLATVNGVEITERMARIYAKRYHVEYTEDNVPGIVGALSGFVTGTEQDADSFLFESPETKDDFKALREAHDMRVAGQIKPEDQFSKVSISEAIPDWVEFEKTLPVETAE